MYCHSSPVLLVTHNDHTVDWESGVNILGLSVESESVREADSESYVG